MIPKSITYPFWITTIAVIMILVVSQLIQDGVFMDGMLYISVSKNLADGLGTFWNPHFSQTSMVNFHEQPPLYFGLLALFYKVFGSSMYVERLFCLICFVITAFFIHKIWKKIFVVHDGVASQSWLPVGIWITIPVCFWAYTNHVEETVMAVFTTIAVYFIYCALFLNKNTIYNLILAGVFIFLSSLTKGFQGMFPIVAAGLYWIIFRKISFGKMILYSLILIGIPALIYLFLILTNPEVYPSFVSYFDKRLVGTFANKGATTDTHFDLLFRLFSELLPVIAASALILYFTRKYKKLDNVLPLRNKTILWFVLIGLSGSLPLMVTLEQRGFYLVTSFPLFALAIAMWLGPRISFYIYKTDETTLRWRIFKITSIVLLIASIGFTATCIGKTKRDNDMLADIYDIGTIVPRGDIINIPHEMWNEWSFREYLIRYYYISTAKCCNTPHTYFITRKDLPKTLVPEGYNLYPLPTREIDLYVAADKTHFTTNL